MNNFGAKRVVYQNYSHHIKNQFGIDPVETIGTWCVYEFEQVPKGWPGGGICLAIELTASQIQYLRNNSEPMPVEPEELPTIYEE